MEGANKSQRRGAARPRFVFTITAWLGSRDPARDDVRFPGKERARSNTPLEAATGEFLFCFLVILRPGSSFSFIWSGTRPPFQPTFYFIYLSRPFGSVLVCAKVLAHGGHTKQANFGQ
jgi:hypothetical protein